MARRPTRRNSAETVENETPVTETPAEAEGQSEENTVTATAAEVEQTENVEAPEANEAAEPAEPATENAEAGSTEPQDANETSEPEADPVEALMALSEQLLDERDRSTATLPEAVVGKFGEEYRKLDSGQKRQARTKITARVQELLDDDSETMMDSILKAKAYNELMNETKRAAAPASRAAAAAKVDPTEAYVDQYLGLALATMALPKPEGFDEEKAAQSIHKLVGAYNDPESDEAKKFQAYLAWHRNTDTENRGDEPEVPEYVKRSVKIAEGKAGGRGRRTGSSGTRAPRQSGGPQGNIEIHVKEALAGREIGEVVSIAEIAKFVSSEYGEDKRPSAGAISARLFPSSGGPCTIEGVEGVLAADSPLGKKGARRTA